MRQGDCTMYVVKTMALISFAMTALLICVFVFAYTKSRFSHDEAHMKRLTDILSGSVFIYDSNLLCLARFDRIYHIVNRFLCF